MQGRVLIRPPFLGEGSVGLRPRILVVDDHEAVRLGIRSLLSWEWDVCGEATDGIEAIALVRELKPDLVILDLTMPNMGGAQAARAIRNAEPHVKIIVFTMHESKSVKELAELVGADAFLSKTCAAEQLKNTVAEVLSKKTKSAHQP